MYKVGHSSVPRSAALGYNGRHNVTSRTELYEKRPSDHHPTTDLSCKYQMQLPLPVFPKKTHRTTVVEPKSVVDTEAVSCLASSWKKFLSTTEGNPDPSIIHYKAKKDALKGFVAFDVEKYITESILKAIDIDPKIVSGLY